MITPEQLAVNGSEDGEQLALMCWAALNLKIYPDLKWLFHIPNGGFRNKREAGKLKAMGVKSGVPDLCLPVKRGEFSGLYIELKVLKTKLKSGKESKEKFTSDKQDNWLEFLKSQGYGTIVCHGWQSARDTLISYLEWK